MSASNKQSELARSLALASLVCAAALLVWGAFLDVAPFEGTEARRASIAREMLETGDFVVPRLGGEVTLTKPPLHYWLEAAAMACFGESRAASRVPALLLLALLLGACFLAGQSMGRGKSYAWAACLVLVCHPVVAKFAVSAEIDGTFAAWIGLSLLALAAASRPERARGFLLGSGLFAGCALLTKGPPLFVFLLPAWLARSRGRRLSRSLGEFGVWLVPTLVPLGLWLALLSARGELAGLLAGARGESVGRVAFFELGDLAEIPLYVASVAGLCLPALVVPLLGRRDAKPPAREPLRVVLWGGLGGALLLCLFPHRPTRYVLPALVPLCFWCLHATRAWLGDEGPGLRRLRQGAGLFALAGILPLAFLAPAWLTAAPFALSLLFLASRRSGALPTFAALGLASMLVLLVDVAARNRLAPRNVSRLAPVLVRELGERRVHTFGHVPAQFVWHLPGRVVYDEYQRAPETPGPHLYEVHARVPAGTRVRRVFSVRRFDLRLAEDRDR